MPHQIAGQIPEGFAPHFRKSGLTDPWEPLYSRNAGEAIFIGLRTAPAHANSRGLVHGALMTALADNAMGLSCALKTGSAGGLVTINLAMDFLAPAQMGQWLEIRPVVLKAGGAMAFASAAILADDELCARANATFKVVRQVQTAA